MQLFSHGEVVEVLGENGDKFAELVILEQIFQFGA